MIDRDVGAAGNSGELGLALTCSGPPHRCIERVNGVARQPRLGSSISAASDRPALPLPRRLCFELDRRCTPDPEQEPGGHGRLLWRFCGVPAPAFRAAGRAMVIDRVPKLPMIPDVATAAGTPRTTRQRIPPSPLSSGDNLQAPVLTGRFYCEPRLARLTVPNGLAQHCGHRVPAWPSSSGTSNLDLPAAAAPPASPLSRTRPMWRCAISERVSRRPGGAPGPGRPGRTRAGRRGHPRSRSVTAGTGDQRPAVFAPARHRSDRWQIGGSTGTSGRVVRAVERTRIDKYGRGRAEF